MIRLIDIILVLVWISIFSFVFIVPEFSELPDLPINKLEALKIYNKTNYVEWDRQEVIQFSFDQLNTAINYLFIAAGALLGLILKVLIDPIFEASKPKLDPLIRVLMIHSSFGCLLSIVLGFYAKMFFNDLLIKDTFSFYNSELGLAGLFQIISFVIAGILLLISSIRLIKIYYK